MDFVCLVIKSNQIRCSFLSFLLIVFIIKIPHSLMRYDFTGQKYEFIIYNVLKFINNLIQVHKIKQFTL